MSPVNFLQRQQRLQQALEKCGCDAFLIENPTDLYYLSGLELSKGTMLVSANVVCLFVDARYIEDCKENAPCRVESDSAISSWLQEHPAIATIGFDAAAMSCLRHSQWQQQLKIAANEHSRQYVLVAVDSPVKLLRRVKDGDEIALLTKAASLGSKGFDYVCTLLKEGVTEALLARELEIFWKKQGGDGLAFDPIIAFGANSSKPHYRSGEKALKWGDTVLIDIGVRWKHYHSDMTRTLFFGPPSPQMQEIYNVVREAQLKALTLCCPGSSINDLDDAARQAIAARGFGEFFTHRLGHGVGLEIHEEPSIMKSEHFACLEEGMVITVEPGIYLPSIGGVRIEDSVLITANGHINLTDRSKELVVLSKNH